MLWKNAVPTLSIDGAEPVDMTWGCTQFDLRIGTHRLYINVRPGELGLEHRSIGHTVEIASQCVHQLNYQAPAVPGFRPRLVDLQKYRPNSLTNVEVSSAAAVLGLVSLASCSVGADGLR